MKKARIGKTVRGKRFGVRKERGPSRTASTPPGPSWRGQQEEPEGAKPRRLRVVSEGYGQQKCSGDVKCEDEKEEQAAMVR